MMCIADIAGLARRTEKGKWSVDALAREAPVLSDESASPRRTLIFLSRHMRQPLLGPPIRGIALIRKLFNHLRHARKIGMSACQELDEANGETLGK
jgi:hypothetical protein